MYLLLDCIKQPFNEWSLFFGGKKQKRSLIQVGPNKINLESKLTMVLIQVFLKK